MSYNNFAFADVPVIRYARSRFDLSHTVTTAGNVGTLYPFEVQEVYPGDTFKIRTAFVSRLASTFIKPVMDNLYLDMYYFYVPDRIIYDQFVNVMGENTESAWANTQEYEVPVFPTNQLFAPGSVGDFMGLPVDLPCACPVSVLPFRAFAKIYDDWFRDENNVDPMLVQKGDYVVSEKPNVNVWSPSNYTGLPPKVSKFPDYFTSCLPAPQKGSAVNIPLSGFSDVNVMTTPDTHPMGGGTIRFGGPGPSLKGAYSTHLFYANSNVGEFSRQTSSPLQNVSGFSIDESNLIAQTSQLRANPFSVNDLRFAFQYQKMLERDARSGSRYIEFLASHFSVSGGDYRLQRSEFLGGRRIPINVTQVVQSTGASATPSDSTLGELAGYSLTGGRSRFTKSFTEHGFIIGVYCIRYQHTYQQGVERFWNRYRRTDFYDPVFSHIGEQPVYKSELYATFPQAHVSGVFGYNEAWADLRTRINHVTGQMRSGVENSYDVWHFADDYSNAPTLNQQFIEETPVYVDRTIGVESTASAQFLLNFYIQSLAYRVMPKYSVPSLIDHD